MSIVKDLTRKLGGDAIMFGLFAFSDTHFRQSFSLFHRVILAAALKFQKLAIAASRGHGKSTVVSFLYVIFCIVFKRKRHIIILQNTLSKATGTLATIKYEVQNNVLLEVFKIKVTKDTKEEAIFEHSDGFQTRVLCKGYEQMVSIRGEKFIAWRPDLVVCHARGSKIWQDGRLINIEDCKWDKKFIKKEVIGIKVNGIPFDEKVTKEHRFWSCYKKKFYGVSSHKNNRSGTWKISDKTDWCESQDLTVNHYVGTPIDKTVSMFETISIYFPGKILNRDKKGKIVSSGGEYKEIIPEYFYDKDFWWAIGLWWGDGSTAKTTVCWSCADKYPNIKTRLIDFINRYGSAIRVKRDGKYEEILWANTSVSRWLKTWRDGNSIKFPPMWVRTIEDKYLKEICRGYIDSDGFVDVKNGCVRVTSVNYEGLLIFSKMLSRIGICSHIRKGIKGKCGVEIQGRMCKTQDKFDLYFSDNAHVLGIELKNRDRYDIRRSFIKDGFLWRKVEKIEYFGEYDVVPIKTKDSKYETPIGLSHNCDDLEDDKTVLNPDLRAECERIFNDAVDPAIDYTSGGQLLFIGTILHDDCLIAKLISPNQYLEFKKYRFQARNVDSDGNKYALWPEKYSLEDLAQIERDDPIKFAKEYQNDPISGARQQFHESDFRRWDIQNGFVVLFNADGGVMSSYALTDCKAAIGCDLAWSEKKEADSTVLFPGLLTPGDEILLDYYFAKKGLRPDEFENILFEMVEKYEGMTGYICEVGFEKAMLEKVVKWMLGKAMRVRGKYLVLKDIKWDKDKITRIVTTLQPRYVNHTIFHRSGMGEYEHQLLRIPSGTHDDLCLVGSTKILTNAGEKRIDKIKVGDMVLTRDGYKSVLNVMYNGEKNVISRFGIKGTPNHPVITKNCVKRLDELNVCDIVYIWNEKSLSIMEKSIAELQNQNEGNIESTFGGMINGKSLLSRCIDKFGLIISEKFQKIILFIIRMVIRLTTPFQILNVFQGQIICAVTHHNQKEFYNPNKTFLLHKMKQKSGIKAKKEESGIVNTQKKFLKIENIFQKFVNFVEKSFKLNLIIKECVLYPADRKIKEKVYNLTIQDNHEYFANNILVHNCDASHIVVKLLKYARSGNKKESPKDSEFEWLMKRQKNKLNVSKKDFVFGQKGKRTSFPFLTKESFR